MNEDYRTKNTIKPTLLQILSWLWRSKFAQRYTSESDAEMYDRVARYYFGREALANKIAHIFLKHVTVEPTRARIYDRAAGTGIITGALLAAGFRVCASDKSASQRHVLTSKYKDVQMIEEDINDPLVGVKDESFDGMVQVAADRFLTPQGQELFATEAARVLKIDGVLVWPVFLGESITGKYIHGSLWRATVSAKCHLLKKYGFSIVDTQLSFDGWIPSTFCVIVVAKKGKK